MNPPTGIALCATCGGHGYLRSQRERNQPCPTCGTHGTAVWWAGKWWSWQQPLTAGSIAARHTEHVLKIIVSAFAMALLLGGLLWGGPVFYRAALDQQLISTLVTHDVRLAAWWLGIAAGLYVTYRLERDALLMPLIPAATGATQPAGTPWGGTTKPEDLASLFPEESHRVLEHAWRLAQARKQAQVLPSHLVEILSTRPDVASMIVRMGLQPEVVREKLRASEPPAAPGSAQPSLSMAAQLMIAEAFLIAAQAHHDRIRPTTLMAAVGSLDDPARDVMFDLGLDQIKLEHVLAWLMIQEDLRTKVRRYQRQAALKPKGAIDRGFTAAATPVLSHFSHDLTIRARNGNLPYVIGRDEELKRIFRVLESGHQSVMLLGQPGVGKTNVLYALAERMVTEDVPEPLQDKRLVSLSAAALVSGAGKVGDLEERVTTITHELARAGNIVLAIEDFDQLVGVSSSGGGLDAAHIFAHEIQQGGLLVIATASPAAYRRVIEPSGTGSAFQSIEIPEMSVEHAIVAVESRIGGLEAQHAVFFTYDAIDHAVRLAQRYLHDSPLPGKALEILGEAATVTHRARGKNALVLKDDVDSIVSEESKVNVRSVTQDEQTKLLHLEDALHQRVIGQDEAVNAVANALRRARAEIRDAKRPIASFLFLGPTGVGKTELAKTVAAVYFGSEDAMVRIDMSEYQEVSSIDRLIGNPQTAGGGQLTDAIRVKPFSIVLLDELEKAHPDILNLFLQVMDDGRLTDAAGRTVDFTNAIIIATSNAGTQHMQNRFREGIQLETIKNELINQELQRYYRPEFLNRFDAIVVFKPLSPIQVVKIVDLMMRQVTKSLAEKGITFKVAPEAIAELAQQGFDPTFGARPLRRLVQEKVDNALATFLLQGKLGRRDVATLEPGGQIRVTKAQ